MNIYKNKLNFLSYDTSCNECRVCKLFLNDLMLQILSYKKGILFEKIIYIKK